MNTNDVGGGGGTGSKTMEAKPSRREIGERNLRLWYGPGTGCLHE